MGATFLVWLPDCSTATGLQQIEVREWGVRLVEGYVLSLFLDRLRRRYSRMPTRRSNTARTQPTTPTATATVFRRWVDWAGIHLAYAHWSQVLERGCVTVNTPVANQKQTYVLTITHVSSCEHPQEGRVSQVSIQAVVFHPGRWVIVAMSIARQLQKALVLEDTPTATWGQR